MGSFWANRPVLIALAGHGVGGLEKQHLTYDDGWNVLRDGFMVCLIV